MPSEGSRLPVPQIRQREPYPFKSQSIPCAVDSELRGSCHDLDGLTPALAVYRAAELAVDACQDVDRRAGDSDFHHLDDEANQMDAMQLARHLGHEDPIPYDRFSVDGYHWCVTFDTAFLRLSWYTGKNQAVLDAARAAHQRPVKFGPRFARSLIGCVEIALCQRYDAILRASDPEAHWNWRRMIERPPFREGIGFRFFPCISRAAVSHYSAAVFRALREVPRFDWAELKVGLAAEFQRVVDTLDEPGEPLAARASASAIPLAAGSTEDVHAPDFRSATWNGVYYEFTGPQAGVVEALWIAFHKGTPSVGAEYLIDKAGTSQTKLSLVFRDHAAWGVMIVEGRTKGSYRLAEKTS